MTTGEIYNFGSELAQTYKEKCTCCGTEIEISTQKDEYPEYYTDIYVKCPVCGSSIHFVLPVN